MFVPSWIVVVATASGWFIVGLNNRAQQPMVNTYTLVTLVGAPSDPLRWAMIMMIAIIFFLTRSHYYYWLATTHTITTQTLLCLLRAVALREFKKILASKIIIQLNGFNWTSWRMKFSFFSGMNHFHRGKHIMAVARWRLLHYKVESYFWVYITTVAPHESSWQLFRMVAQ